MTDKAQVQQPPKPAGSANDVPRCPLGFTGTPPIGHPTIPGFGSSSSTTTNGDAKKATNGTAPAAAAAAVDHQEQVRKTYRVLMLDAAFLAACVAVAVFWPQLRRALAWIGVDVRRA